MKSKWIWLAGWVALICAGGFLIADWYQVTPETGPRSFVGRSSCIECHQTEAALFEGSHHDLAMDLATEATVLGDFNNAELEHFGIRSRFFRDGERFMVHTEGPDGEMGDFEIKYVFGVDPLQQYMVELDRGNAAEGELGRVQVLRLSWDTRRGKWFYLLPPDVNERIQPGDPLHWTGITQCWNASCADCHSTNLQRGFDPLERNYHTTFSEIDVSCEACHGPGSFHVQLAQERNLFWDRAHGYGLVKLKTVSNRPQVETCAPCHSRRGQMRDGFQPGCNFDDYYALQLIEEPVYHADGQIRDEDYVYGSFIQSKMYHQGIRCTDCHDPHSTRVKYPDNQLCTSCHQQQHPAAKYDTPAHHHHAPGSAGALCINCHMPATTYMMVDARRDHSFRVPRPDLSVETGTPNACTGCHLEPDRLAPATRGELGQYLDWIVAAEGGDAEVEAELARVNERMRAAFEEWYPAATAPPRSEYYSELARGLAGPAGADEQLVALAKDRTVPGIFRASALNGLTGNPEILAVARESLKDPDPKAVVSAIGLVEAELNRRLQRSQYDPAARKTVDELVDLLAPLLERESYGPRIAAARVLVGIPGGDWRTRLSADQRRAFDVALEEFKRSLLVTKERGVSHARLGNLYEQLGQLQKAQDAYRTAMRVEPGFVGPRSNLAALLDAELEGLREQIAPRSDQAYNRQQSAAAGERAKQLAEQAFRLRREEYELLRKDIERAGNLPGTHSLHYRFAMAAYLQGNLDETGEHLQIALEQEPDNPMYRLGLATYYLQRQQPAESAPHVQWLVEQDPENEGYRSLARQVSEQMRADRENTGSEKEQ